MTTKCQFPPSAAATALLAAPNAAQAQDARKIVSAREIGRRLP
jgi:hypothetical protein